LPVLTNVVAFAEFRTRDGRVTRVGQRILAMVEEGL